MKILFGKWPRHSRPAFSYPSWHGRDLGFGARAKKSKITDFKGFAKWLDHEGIAKLIEVITEPQTSIEALTAICEGKKDDIEVAKIGLPEPDLLEALGKDVSGEIKHVIKEGRLQSKDNDLKDFTTSLHSYAIWVSTIKKTSPLRDPC